MMVIITVILMGVTIILINSQFQPGDSSSGSFSWNFFFFFGIYNDPQNIWDQP